jgi:hypothetical protein
MSEAKREKKETRTQKTEKAKAEKQKREQESEKDRNRKKERRDRHRQKQRQRHREKEKETSEVIVAHFVEFFFIFTTNGITVAVNGGFRSNDGEFLVHRVDFHDLEFDWRGEEKRESEKQKGKWVKRGEKERRKKKHRVFKDDKNNRGEGSTKHKTNQV